MHLRLLVILMVFTMRFTGYRALFKKQRKTQHYRAYGIWLTPRQNRNLIKKESALNGGTAECCPTIEEMIEPVGGVNQDGLYVELFANAATKQRFYEVSCHPDIENKPCRFMVKTLHNQSRCVQKYSYTNAITQLPGTVRHSHHRTSWMFDFIRVRSGCSCELVPRKRIKKRRNKNDF